MKLSLKKKKKDKKGGVEMNSSLYLPHLLASQKLRLPKKNFPGSAREKKKIAALIGANVKSCKSNDSDAEEEEDDDAMIDTGEQHDGPAKLEDSSDSSLPEDWLDRYNIQSHRPPWMSRSSSSSEDQTRSSDDWSTISAELSDETRSGRTSGFFFFFFFFFFFSHTYYSADPRPIPVFLGSYDESDFMDVSGDGGVLKRVFQRGQVGNRPFEGYLIDLKYVVFLPPSMTVVDVSQNDMWENKEHKFTIGSGEVIRGLEVAALSMERKEKARFRIRSDYAFGSEGSPPKIPPNTEWLVLDIEMMGLRRPIKDKMFLRPNEVLPYVLARKEKVFFFFFEFSLFAGKVFIFFFSGKQVFQGWRDDEGSS